MIEFIKNYWKKGLDIGRDNSLHYLERQRISILNSICLLVAIASLVFTVFYTILDLKNNTIGLSVLPLCILVLWLNSKFKFKLAKNIAFFGILAIITFWCFFSRNTGSHYYFIAAGCGVASIFKKKKYIFGFMIICAIFFTSYCYWNWITPIVLDPAVNYDLLNFS
jgi:O-antigen ligase